MSYIRQRKLLFFEILTSLKNTSHNKSTREAIFINILKRLAGTPVDV